MDGATAPSGVWRSSASAGRTVEDLLSGAQRVVVNQEQVADGRRVGDGERRDASNGATELLHLQELAVAQPVSTDVDADPFSQTPISAVSVAPLPRKRTRRLMIERVVLENFKSYGQKRVIGPFHKRFTAVVGPNGSGKSNVIDAMLFVFGRRAQQIRLKKVTELIHNSASVAAAAAEENNHDHLRPKKKQTVEVSDVNKDPILIDRASVSVFFQEIIDPDPCSEDFEVVEGSQFVVSREVSRQQGGVTAFSINGRRCLQRDVISLLKSRGLDLSNNRFLILQGEVEQIALMKPKAQRPEETGFLEYLEDLIGTDKYVEPIEQAKKEFEILCDQYHEKAQRLKAAAADLAQHRHAKEAAVGELKAHKEAATARLILTALKRKAVSAEVVKTTKAFREIEEKKQNAENRAKVLLEKQKTLDQEIDRQKEASKVVEAEFAEAEGELQRLVWRDEELRGELQSETSLLKKKEKQLQEGTANSAACEKKLEKLEKELELHGKDGVSVKLASAEKAVEEAREAVEAMQEQIKGQVASLSALHSAAEQQLLKQQQQLDKALSAAAKVTTALQLLERRASTIRENQQQAKTQLQSCADTEASKVAALAHQEKQQEALGEERKSLERQLAEAEKRVQDLQEKASFAKSSLRRAEQQRQELQSSNRVIAALANAKKSGKLRGLHDRLGELGSIDKKYERAFLAASGGFCGFFVVDSPQDATELFDLLRRQEGGRAHVLALQVLERDLAQRMRDADAEAQHWKDAACPRLLDLLSFKHPMFRVAFFKAVGDTRVAPDLDKASHIAYSLKKRVVTLEGGLIEVDGRMVGGGLSFSRDSGIRTDGFAGNAGLADVGTALEGEGDLASLAQNAKKVQKELAEADAKRNELRDALRGNEKQRAEGEAAVELLRQDIQAARTQKSLCEKRLEGAMREALTDAEKAEHKTLKEKAAAAAAEQAELNAKVVAQEEKTQHLLRELQEAGGPEMKQRRQKLLLAERNLNKLRQSSADLEGEIAKTRAAIANAQRDASRLLKETKSHEERIKEITDQLHALEGDAREVLDKKERANEAKSEAAAAVSKLQQEKKQVADEHKKLELATLETQHECSSLQQKLQQQKSQQQQQKLHVANALERLLEIVDLLEQNEDEAAAARTRREETEPPNEDLAIEDKAESDDDGDDGGDNDNKLEEQSQAQDKNAFLDKGQRRALRRLGIDLGDAALDAYTADDQRSLQQQQMLLQQQPNLHALQLYAQKRADVTKKESESQKAWALREEAKRQLDFYSTKRKDEFLAAFSFIAAKLKEIYRMLSQGGDAELELVDASDPFSEGVLLSVRPPKKSWRQIQNLSGGEKTLSSLSLVFALHAFKPTCVYFLDEIDAALDHRNVSILGAFVQQQALDAQFIIISLRNQLFELANRLVGIYKTFDVTKSVALDPHKFLPQDEEAQKQTHPQGLKALEASSSCASAVGQASQTQSPVIQLAE